MAIQILNGLPATGAAAIGFSLGGTGLHREGLVVDFNGEWTGNFAQGKSNHTAVYHQFAPHFAHVISMGHHYLVDIRARQAKALNLDWITASLFCNTSKVLILFDLNVALAYRGDVHLWQSARIAWDSFRQISQQGSEIVGEAYNPMDDLWAPFRLDPVTGDLMTSTWP